MSPDDPISSLEELIELECGRLKNVVAEQEQKIQTEKEKLERENELLKNVVAEREQKIQTEKEKLERENELLKKEVEELRLKKIESDKAAQLHKTRVHDLEEMMLKAKTTLAGVFKADSEMKRTTLKVKIKLANSARSDSSPISLSNKVKVTNPTNKLTRRCNLKIIEKIKKTLNKEDLEKFEGSCFGHMLKIKALEFQEQVLLQLLKHIDLAASSNEKLVFKFNGCEAEFGPSDFSSITGLRLGTVEATSIITSSCLHQDVFKGKTAIFLKNIKRAFRKASRAPEGRDDLTLKLSLLYFLYGVLLGGNQLQELDLKYLHLVEDLHKFNEFPWGQVVFEFLVSFMLSAQSQMDCTEAINKKPRLEFHGFVHALQIWAYEVMPSVAKYCAVRVSDPENLTPRILQWSAPKKTILPEELKKFFEMDDKAHLAMQGIEASPREMEELSNEIPPQPKKAKLSSEQEEMCDDAADNLSTYNKANVVKLVEGRSSSAATDIEVVVLRDSDDDEDEAQNTRRGDDSGETKRKRSVEREADESVFRFSDSDDDSCSTAFMDNYVASLQR